MLYSFKNFFIYFKQYEDYNDERDFLIKEIYPSFKKFCYEAYDKKLIVSCFEILFLVWS